MGREVLLGIQITEEFAINPAHKNVFLRGLTETTFGLIPPRYRLPKCQAVKLTFLAASSIFKESFFDLHHKCNQLNLFWSTLGIASSQTSII